MVNEPKSEPERQDLSEEEWNMLPALLKAADDLCFDCDGVLGTKAPRREVYNLAFAAIKAARKRDLIPRLLAHRAQPAVSRADAEPSADAPLDALRDALNDMDVALGAHGRTHVPVKTISDWIEHARQRVAALAAAPRDRTCAVCGRVETEDLNDPTRCRSRLLREGGSPFFDDLCLRAGPQLRAAAPRDRPDARGPGFAQCWCGPGMAPDHEGPHLAASAPLAAPSAPTPEKQSPAPAAKMDDRLRQVRGWLDAIRIRCREGDPTTDWLPKIAEFADTGIAILDKQSAAASLEVEALDGEWLAAIDSWRKCSSKRLSWASGGHCSACGPLQKLMARAVLRRGGR